MSELKLRPPKEGAGTEDRRQGSKEARKQGSKEAGKINPRRDHDLEKFQLICSPKIGHRRPCPYRKMREVLPDADFPDVPEAQKKTAPE
jgi:hypothetical protein